MCMFMFMFMYMSLILMGGTVQCALIYRFSCHQLAADVTLLDGPLFAAGGGSGECGQDAGAGEQCGWLDAEALEERSALILLAGSALEDATGGRFAAARHSVASSPAGARLSCVFELRSA